MSGTAESGDTGTWTQSGPFNDVRAGAVAVRLLDGRVLLAGGSAKPSFYSQVTGTAGTASAEIFDPGTGQWTSTGSMNFARAADAAATLLPDGRVLVAGGRNDTSFLQSVEIYDPLTETWSTGGSMMSNSSAQAVLLTDGRVLLLHPTDVNGLVPGELFDPVRGTFQPMAPLYPASTSRRVGTLLASGKVLILDFHAPPAAYDPSTNSYSMPAGSCSIGNGGYQAWLRLLPDGRVLCRDDYIPGGPIAFLNSYRGFIYDPQRDSTGGSSAAAPGPDVLLPSGRVLIAGGPPPPPFFPATLYDASSEQISPGTAPTLAVRSMVLLDDGRALAFGVDPSDPSARTFSTFAGIFSPPAFNNPPPYISSVSASTPKSDVDSISLEVRGSAFLSNSFVQIDSMKLVTLFLGSDRLVAFVTPGLRGTLSAGVSVVNPAPGGGTTDPVPVGFVAPSRSGTISATPNPCTIPSPEGVCTSTISWNTQNVSSIEVRLSVNGGAEQSFTGSTSGSEDAPWISGGNNFRFGLYDRASGAPLSFVTVTATGGGPPSGTISAAPNPCTITSTLPNGLPFGVCTSTISWSTQNVSSIEVRLSVNGGTKQLFASGPPSGSAPAPWISPRTDFTFWLYDRASGVLLSSVTVTAAAAGPSGRIRAAPNPCFITYVQGSNGYTASSGGMCTSIISWSTQNVSSAEVRLTVNGSPEQLFAAGTSGSAPASWISNGHQFLFLLYDAGTGQLLDFIQVFTANCYAPMSCQQGPGSP